MEIVISLDKKYIITMKKNLLASVALVLASCGDKAPYEGTYEGTFPCADCDGINVSLTIGKDTYTSEEVMNELTDEDNGKVSYDAQNKVLTLTSEKENGKIQQYQVKEDGSIVFLDEGKEITGTLASYYILKKK
jgi:lipoprotein